jgi:hypothetical protein
MLHETLLHVVFQAVSITGWALSIGMTFILVHGLYGDLDPIMSASYVALSHTAWAIAVAWIVIACSTGNGGRYLSHSTLMTTIHGTSVHYAHQQVSCLHRLHGAESLRSCQLLSHSRYSQHQLKISTIVSLSYTLQGSL